MNTNDPSSALYDPASPNTYDPFQSPINHIDRPPSSQSINPRFLDLDDPSHHAELPLSYDEVIPAVGPLKEALLSKKEAAEQRASEAEILFGPIANILGINCASKPRMPNRQARALKIFRDELVEVASKHFEAYIQGTPAQLTSVHDHQKKLPVENTYVHTPNPKKIYASATRSSDTTTMFPSESIRKNLTISRKKMENNPDDRLFLRLSEESSLRNYSGYTLLSYIKSQLGPDKDLLANVLPTETGFALCPSKDNMAALEIKISASKISGEIRMEKASP